jgi:hypothetical protein
MSVETPMRHAVAVLVLLALLVPCTTGASDKGQYAIRYPGAGDSCGKFVSARDEARRGAPSRENEYRLWLEGYITGISMAAPNTYDVAGSVDLDSMLLWVENRCKQTPLKPFTDTVEALVVEELMPKRQHHAPKSKD